MKKTIKFLKDYNSWRRGGNTKQPDPKVIGVMLDKTVKLLELLDKFNGLPTEVYVVICEDFEYDNIVVSYHNTLEGAYSKKRKYLIDDYVDWYDARIQWGKEKGERLPGNKYYIEKVKVEK